MPAVAAMHRACSQICGDGTVAIHRRLDICMHATDTRDSIRPAKCSIYQRYWPGECINNYCKVCRYKAKPAFLVANIYCLATKKCRPEFAARAELLEHLVQYTPLGI